MPTSAIEAMSDAAASVPADAAVPAAVVAAFDAAVPAATSVDAVAPAAVDAAASPPANIFETVLAMELPMLDSAPVTISPNAGATSPTTETTAATIATTLTILFRKLPSPICQLHFDHGLA
jgi:hypothetical protein